MSPARRLARALYARASASSALRRPVAALRSHPRVRALARRHVDVLLAGAPSWANVDAALRLLAEDASQPIVFGPWEGGLAEELLYWAPFVRWATERFSLAPERVVVASRSGAAAFYDGSAATFLGLGEAEADRLPEGAVFRPEPVLKLVERYRAGLDAPRPLLKRALHQRLPALAPDAPADAYMVVALSPSPAFPDTDANRRLAEELSQALSAAGRVVPATGDERPGALHGLVAGSTGLVSAYSGTALLGLLSAVPTVAVRSRDGAVAEADLDLAQRVASRLGTSFVVLEAADVASLAI